MYIYTKDQSDQKWGQYDLVNCIHLNKPLGSVLAGVSEKC